MRAASFYANPILGPSTWAGGMSAMRKILGKINTNECYPVGTCFEIGDDAECGDMGEAFVCGYLVSGFLYCLVVSEIQQLISICFIGMIKVKKRTR